MSFEEKSKWLGQNPVTAARHFQYRLNTFFHKFLKSKAHPLGELVDYAIRIEFQARGSPHAHTILWIKDAPKFGIESDQEVCDFVDCYVQCGVPADEEVAELVTKVQKHRHSNTCRRNGRCRFRYPHPPSPRTVIARQVPPDDSSEEIKAAMAAVVAVRNVLDDKNTPEDISLEQLLDRAKVPHDTYVRGLGICTKGNSIVYHRERSDSWINPYNADVMRVWQANMDLQYILDPYGCVMYIASYMLKSEKAMSELLRQVSRECASEDIKTQLRRLGSVFMNHRELSAQEAVYRMLSLPLKQLSRTVVFVSTDTKDKRTCLLKPKHVLDDMDDDSEDIYMTSLIDRYAARPDSLNDMCLAEFAANYTTRSGQDVDDEESTDALPPANEDTHICQKIKLKNGLGIMYKRKRECVIRFHRYNREKETGEMYRAKIMLYIPWRDETVDLLAGRADFKSHYEERADTILNNERKYSKNASLINEAMDDFHEFGPPTHAWDQVAPGAAEQHARAQAEGVEVQRTVDQADLDANAQLHQQHSDTLLQRFTTETNRELLAPDQYRAMVRGLNPKQKQVVAFHRRWCKDAVIAMRKGEPVRPYRVFLSGPGGVGKSHVISLVHNDTVKLLRLSSHMEPDDVAVLLTAPTGVAAFNIQGMTLHSALVLGTTNAGCHPLAQDKLNTLRTKLSNLQLLIIDEVSMVGSDMLLQIHKRLQQLKGANSSCMFGNISILAVGDLFQLQPVCQWYVFGEVSDAYARLHGSGSLWKDEFSMMELDQVMRQQGDKEFAELLCRVRKATPTTEDIEVLQSRTVADDDPNYPRDSLHVYHFNKDVDEQNMLKLNEMAPPAQQAVIRAVDCTKDKRTQQLNITMPKNKSNTGGLVEELRIAVGAKVMLTVNVDVSDGLVNGARGTVEAIVPRPVSNDVSVVLVNFDHPRVGNSAIAKSHYTQDHPRAVPISRHEAVFNIGRNKAVEVSRSQFPLLLAWASTIHKVQGLTLDQIVVDMKGRALNACQAYVAFSRVKSLAGLFIKNFNPSGIKAGEAVVAEMERLAGKCLPLPPTPHVVAASSDTHIKLGHLNVRSYPSKLEDIMQDATVARAHVMCFTETFLKPHQRVGGDLLLNGEPSQVYRADRTSTDAQNLANGGIMIECATSLLPRSLDIAHSPLLEVKAVTVTTPAGTQMCIIAIYRRPQLQLATFLTHLRNYLVGAPHRTLPTVVLGDFNENLSETTANPSPLLGLMNSHGFHQLVRGPTTDSGSLLDHIYYNGPPGSALVDVVDVYYSDHDATFVSLPVSVRNTGHVSYSRIPTRRSVNTPTQTKTIAEYVVATHTNTIAEYMAGASLNNWLPHTK